MTITFRLAACGDTSDSMVPRLKIPIDDCYDRKRDCYDRGRLMSSVACDLVNIGSDDSTNCIVMGCSVLDEFAKQIDKVGEIKWSDAKSRLTPDMKGSERKLYKGQYAFVRIRLHDRADGNVKLTVTYANPKNVPGQCFVIAHEIALFVVQVALAVSAEYNSNGSTCRLFVGDHPSLTGLLAEAVADNERRIQNGKRLFCKHRAGDYCVGSADGEPPDRTCKCFSCGRCVECRS